MDKEKRNYFLNEISIKKKQIILFEKHINKLKKEIKLLQEVLDE